MGLITSFYQYLAKVNYLIILVRLSQFDTSHFDIDFVLAIIPNISLTHGMRNRNLISIAVKKQHSFRENIDTDVLVVEAEEKSAKWWTKEDTHLFVLSFIAFFVVFYTFIA